MTVVVGTAGHIDHGKTTLLRALTGIDADRLPEEQRRGMTIDVGYAHLAFDDGTELDFVDVPGHDRLVGNMLVGAGEVDAALLVVAADDGPRAQTIEHLELLDALGIEVGLAAVTKSDAVEPGRAAEVAAAVAELLRRTSLAGSPVIAVSATRGDGLAELRAALVDVRDRVEARRDSGGTRLAVDRAFGVRGRGIVVTGTLRGEGLARGVVLRLVPGERAVRVRELQVHGTAVESAGPGRTAINLSGPDAAGIARGIVLTADPAVVATNRLLVALRPAAALGDRGAAVGAIPADRTRVQLHLGTARVAGAVGRGGRDSVALESGETTAVLRLDRAVAAAPGDRFVLRRPSPGGTLAGGRVLDPDPPRGVSRKRTTPGRLAALAAAGGGGEDWRRARLDLHGALGARGDAGAGAGPGVAAAVVVADDVAAWLDESIVAAVVERGERPQAEVAEEVGRRLRRVVTLASTAGPPVGAAIERLVDAGRLVRERGRLRDPARIVAAPSPAMVAGMDRLERLLTAAGPPPLGEAARAAGCPPDGVRALESAGRIVRLDSDLAYAVAAFDELRDRALELASREPLTPAAFRDATGTSRKYVMAILEELDRRAILRRTPDGHVPGPRAAAPTAGAGR